MKNPYPVDPKHLKSYFWGAFFVGVSCADCYSPGGGSNLGTVNYDFAKKVIQRKEPDISSTWGFKYYVGRAYMSSLDNHVPS